MTDCRGILRGKCLQCECEQYDGGATGKKCSVVECCHPPGRHLRKNDPSSEGVIQAAISATTATSVCHDLEEPHVPLDQQCLYEGCNHRKCQEGDKVHDFCRRTCADLYKRTHLSSNDPKLICKTPGCSNPKYRKDDENLYDYCSLSCRINPQKEGHAMITPSSERGSCSLPGCENSRYQDPSNGRIHEFCSRSHASQFKPKQTELPQHSVKILKGNDPEAVQVTNAFTTTWDSRKGKCPPIDHVFSISNDDLEQRWESYKHTLPLKNVEKHFHGTKLQCDISSTITLCSSEECGICSIVKIGLDRRCIRKNIQFQRFGHGFYLAPNSSKCHDYTQGKNDYRAMILFDVCPGKKYLLQRDDESITAPPEGHHSVHGKRGISLNYDEIVLYNPDGALPKYIILYKKDGEAKIAQ